MHVACHNSNLEITELLLDEGADPNNPDLVTMFALLLLAVLGNAPANMLTLILERTNSKESRICA